MSMMIIFRDVKTKAENTLIKCNSIKSNFPQDYAEVIQ